MECPNCKGDRLKFNRIDKSKGSRIRWYKCEDCGESICTDEVRVVYTGSGYVPAGSPPTVQLPPIPEEAKVRKRDPSPVVERMRVVHVPADNWGLPASMARDIKYWWEQSRWIKHGGRAVWTERAFLTSVRRLRTLHDASPADAVALLEEAVEKGWQGVDPRYLNRDWPRHNSRAAAAAQSGPKDPSMQAALASWNENP
jgi:hypothetical protein